MTPPDKIIKVSRQSILRKNFNTGVTAEQLQAELSGPELDEALALLPTAEEAAFMQIFDSRMPELARLQRKMAVCLDVEVVELSEDSISYVYGERTFTVHGPKNTFRLFTALNQGELEAFTELCAQGCVLADGVPVNLKEGKTPVDELALLMRVASKFFFQIYMVS